MPQADAINPNVLVLGVGNTLLSDDGIGVHVVEYLKKQGTCGPSVALRDGGTIGLHLLPEVEAAEALIVVDAAELGAAPGSMKTFENGAMDAHLSGCRNSVHEVAMMDLLCASRLSGRAPARRMLIAVQPQSTAWGTEPTSAVASAVPAAGNAVRMTLERWGYDHQ